MNILFICKHNVFRSRIAEEYMKKINSCNIHSGGLIRTDYPPTNAQIKVAKEYDIELCLQSKGLDIATLQNQDYVIIIADDVPKQIFEHPTYGLEGKIKVWHIKDIDTNKSTEKNIRYIINEIISNVNKFNETLK